MLDLKTIVVSYSTSNVLIVMLMAILWRQNQKRYDGLSLWLIASIMQALGTSLHIPRGILPDFITIIIANTLFIGGHLVWYIGLERFVGKQRTQIHNVLILTIFVCLMLYFTYVRANISMRVILWSTAAFLITAQCSELMLRRVDPWLKPITRYVGLIFLLYTMIIFARLVLFSLLSISPDTSLFRLPIEDTLILLVLQMINLGLMFALIMMVIGRQRLDIRKQDAERMRTEKALRESEENFHAIASLFPAAIAILKSDQRGERFLYVNAAWTTLTGYSRDDAMLLEPKDIIHPDLRRQATEQAAARMRGEDVPSRYENIIITRSGEIKWLDFAVTVIRYQGAPAILTIAFDTTERKRAEEALRESESKYRTLVENIPQRIFTKNRDLIYVSCNVNFARDLGITPGQIAGKTDYDFFPGKLADKYRADDKRILETGQTEEIEEKYRHTGQEVWIQTLKTPIQQEDGGIVGILGVFYDITERKRAEAEREKLQAQLNQAQKMEAVGRLAGGVAHDYNNILSVIIGYSELAMDKVGTEDPLREDLNEIYSAANRSRDITRQLLAFARKETIAPEVLDLNATVENMLKILRKLIGEDIDLAWHPGKVPGPVLMDPSQLDQILANLCINARDAIANVGRITIETGTATIDADYCSEHAGFIPGEFVLLAVSDDGYGMDGDTVDHIFEPFFTTKGVGKGTGLGLSTVYGIVKQNNGFINVYSELGQGTTFNIYLPRHLGDISGKQRSTEEQVVNGNGETVLVVEDEMATLKLTERILSRCNYNVLLAKCPSEALGIAKAHSGEISLLLTDVVMPEMNGRELANQLKTFCPGIKCLFMSGYTANVIGHRGVLDKGVQFIHKPFSIKGLAAKVREALEEETK